MTDEALRNTLAMLRRKLDDASAITDEERALLSQLSIDIAALLAKPGAMTRVEHQSLTDRLESAVTHFEVSHPDLTATMAQVTKALGDMGI